MPRTSPRTPLARGQPGIQSFARATKPGVSALDAAADRKKPGTGLAPSPSKKRKLNELENVDCSTRGKGDTAAADAPGCLTPSKSLRISDLSLSTPRSGHYVSLARSRTLAAGDRPVAASSPSKRAPRSVPRRTAPVLLARPSAVNDVLGLHSAFLKALTIHAAHQGSSTPADMREFLYSVERLWKKRKVVVKDIQHLLWVRDQCHADVGPAYRLANYGLGRVCLEKLVREGRTDRVNETESQEKFEETIDLLWEKALDAAGGDEDQVDFVNTLGVAPVHESLTPFTAFRKGQQRLQDLKGGVIKMKTERLRAGPQAATPEKTPEATTARRTGLLDRIRDKALRQSKLPPPPTKEMLLHRAAVQRVEEVAGVLSLLKPAGYVGTGIKALVATRRTPFRMEMIVQNVQDSLRTPISAKEVEVCLEILSRADIAGQWVELVTVNQMKSVVLKSCNDVNTKEIGAKVATLKIGWEGHPSTPEMST